MITLDYQSIVGICVITMLIGIGIGAYLVAWAVEKGIKEGEENYRNGQH